METRTRLMVTRAGLPEPRHDVPVKDASGEWIATGDVGWQEQRVLVEFLGEDAHSEFKVRRADSYRRTLIEEAGWIYVEIFAIDVFNSGRRALLLERLARHLGIDLVSLSL